MSLLDVSIVLRSNKCYIDSVLLHGTIYSSQTIKQPPEKRHLRSYGHK